MPLPSQTTTSGSTVRHDGGIILRAGNVASGSGVNSLTVRNSLHKTSYASFANETNANNGLATRPLSTGDYAKMTKGRFIAAFLTGGYIAGLASTILTKPCGDPTHRSMHRSFTARRYHITSWNYVTGAATKGGSAGASYSFINPSVAGGATATTEDLGSPNVEWTTSAELFYIVGKTPTAASYTVRKG